MMKINEKQMKQVIKQLTAQKKTIATMESCTGGTLASAITNIPGASEVFQFGAVTYENAYKIKLGVPQETIETYTVYSKETAIAMAKAIVRYTNADYGIGITGKLNREDPKNEAGKNNEAFVGIYQKANDKITVFSLEVTEPTREGCKAQIINAVLEILNTL